MDITHLSIWFHCLTASEDREHAFAPKRRDQLSNLLDLPAACGGIGLQLLEYSADEDFVGSIARITTSIILFCTKAKLPVDIEIA